jgi:superfamily II DNA or RNA helicase
LRYFFDSERISNSTWQGFERDTARYLMFQGFSDVRLIGGSGDKGADILGVLKGEQWVVQCKHYQRSRLSTSVVGEVFKAAQHYKADKIAISLSQIPGPAIEKEIHRYEKIYSGLKIVTLTPKHLTNEGNLKDYPEGKKKLRDYQHEVVDNFIDALTQMGKAQIIMATGLGKTVVMAETIASLIRSNPNIQKILVLAHTRPIINQLHQNFWYQLSKWVPTQQMSEGELPISFEGVTFALIQSIVNKLDVLPRFDLILVDEAHHIGSLSYLKSLENISPNMLAGVTATPWRGDRFDLDSVLGAPVCQIGIEEGLRRGFLAEVDYRLLADNLDWEFVKQRSVNNYSIASLNKKLFLPQRDEKCVQIIQKAFKEEKRNSGIVFCQTIEHSEEFTSILRHYEMRAEVIHSDMDGRERENIMSKFKAGKLDFVTTVDLFNEGVDVPDVDMLVFMRVTHSRRIFVQQIGRGLRLSDNKDRVIILDFVSDLRRMADVLKLDSDVRGGTEKLGLGRSLVSFEDKSAGSYLKEWILDQADLFSRIGDSSLEKVSFDFPEPRDPGNVQ